MKNFWVLGLPEPWVIEKISDKYQIKKYSKKIIYGTNILKIEILHYMEQ